MPLNFEALKEKKARRGTASSGWQPKPGDNQLRFLPFSSRYFDEDVSEIAIEFRSHFLKADGTDTVVVRCPRDKQESCVICESVRKFRDSTDPNLKKNAEAVRVSERHLYNILDLNNPGAGIQAYESGPKVYDDLLAYASNAAYGDILHPGPQGRSFILNLQVQGTRSGFNEYKLQPYPNPTSVIELLPADTKEKLDALSSIIPDYPSQEVLDRWMGLLGFRAATATVAQPAAPAFTLPTAAQPVQSAPATAAPGGFSLPSTGNGFTLPTANPAPQATPMDPHPTAPLASQDPVVVFCMANGFQPVNKSNMLVPQCFSEGPSIDRVTGATGYKPEIRPCHACPKRGDCQVKTMGL